MAKTAQPPEVKAVLDGFPGEVRKRLLETRALIYELSESLGTGPLTETLKWGEPAYLTEISKSGSTIRLGWNKSEPERCQIYFNCQTDLVDRFRAHFPEAFAFKGNRCLSFEAAAPVPEMPLRSCLSMALTYHRDKKRRNRNMSTASSRRGARD